MAKKSKQAEPEARIVDGQTIAYKKTGSIDTGSMAYGRNWWTEDAQTACGSISSNLDFWANTAQRMRVEAYHQQARLYGNLPATGYYGSMLSRYRSYRRNMLSTFLNYNVTQSCVDTLGSKIAQNDPMPFWSVNGGDYKLTRKAENRTKFNQGIAYENKTPLLKRRVLKDSEMFGDGWLWVRFQNGRIKHQVVKPIQVWTDEIEACEHEPIQLHVIEMFDRDQLAKLYPKAANLIANAKFQKLGEIQETLTTMDMVTVRHSWHLPARASTEIEEGTGDGRYIMSVTSGVLLDEEWDHDRFPLARFRFSDRPLGWFGQGLVEQLAPMQMELQSLLYRVQRAMEIAGFYKILVPEGSNIPTDWLLEEDATGVIFPFAGTTPPSWLVPPMVQTEVYEQIQAIYQRAFDVTGISQMAASSEKPAGLNSGAAIRTYADIGTERFATLGKDWECFTIDISDLNIMTLKDAMEQNKDVVYEVATPNKARLDLIDWKTIALDQPDDIFFLRVQPTSSLPDDIAGKMQTITELIQASFIDQDTGREMLNMPDMERFEALTNSERDNIMRTLDGIVEKGDPAIPEPFNTPKLCLQMAMQYYWNGYNSKLEAPRMEMLRTYIRACTKMIQAAMPPPPPAPPPGPAQATPMAPPQSPLLPFKQPGT